MKIHLANIRMFAQKFCIDVQCFDHWSSELCPERNLLQKLSEVLSYKYHKGKRHQISLEIFNNMIRYRFSPETL